MIILVIPVIYRATILYQVLGYLNIVSHDPDNHASWLFPLEKLEDSNKVRKYFLKMLWLKIAFLFKAMAISLGC